MHVLDPAIVLLLLDYKAAARALGLKEKALRDLVWKRRGPVVTKIGRRRMFYVEDIKEFVLRHRAPNPPLPDPNIPPKKRGGR
jgi:Helix-turn-helix domain